MAIKYRKIKNSEIPKALQLIREDIAKFNKDECMTKKAFHFYLNWYNLKNKKILDNFKPPCVCIVALENNKIIGIAKLRNNQLLSLYVDSKKQGQGIGKKLALKIEKKAKKRNIKFLKIQSSLYATDFYKKLGYKMTTGTRKTHDIKYNPMKKIL